MIGSSRTAPACASASLMAIEPAILKAISEESTEWKLPSKSRTRTPLTGKPATGAVRHRLLAALLDRRDEALRDHAALDLVDELEAVAVGQRLDLDVAVAELAAPAGLLLVAPVGLGRPADRLAVGDARRLERRPRRRSGRAGGRR